MIEAWWVNRQLKLMQWIQPRIQEVWTLGWKKQWLQTWWIEVKTIVQEPVVNPLSARFYRSDLTCERRQVSTDIQLSVISVLMEGHNVTGIWEVRIYDMPDNVSSCDVRVTNEMLEFGNLFSGSWISPTYFLTIFMIWTFVTMSSKLWQGRSVKKIIFLEIREFE